MTFPYSEVCNLDKCSICPKAPEKSFLGGKAAGDRGILRTLSDWKKIKIIEAEVCSDHGHMLVENPPKAAVSRFME